MIDKNGWIDPIAFHNKYGVELYNTLSEPYIHLGKPYKIAPINRPGNKPFIPGRNTKNLVLHTTEGYGILAAYNTLRGIHAGTTFIPGDEVVFQTRPIGFQCGTLRPGPGNICNVLADVQIEIVEKTAMEGNSKFLSWLPKESSLTPLVAAMAFCQIELNMPMRRPLQWQEGLADLHGQIVASELNNRRKSKLYITLEGGYVFGHIEVPYQTHVDPGDLQYDNLFALVNTKVESILAKLAD